MAKIRTMCMYAIFLALNMGHGALFTEGRKMKSTNKVESRPIKRADATEIGVHGIQYINSHHSKVIGKNEDAPPTTPGQIPDIAEHSVAGKKDIYKPMAPHHSLGFGNSAAIYKDGLGPPKHANSPGSSQTFVKFEKNNKPGTLGTTSGYAHYTENKSTPQDHSPGVGHSFVESDEHIKPGGLDSSTGEEHYTKDRVTPQGHSPGVGHPFVESIKDIKRGVRGNGLAERHPTKDSTPHDYSPGVGHSFVDSEDKNTPKLQGHSPGVGHSLKNRNAEPNA